MTFSAQADDAPSLRVIGSYGLLALPLAFAGLPLYIHIPDFYTREMGLSVVSAGIILMALRLLDAVQDPLIGYISDKSLRMQRIVMTLGFWGLLLGMRALLFGPPLSVSVAFWFAGAVAVTALSLSMISINFVMIGSLWNEDEKTRSLASGLREGLSLIGMLLASVLPSILFLSVSKSQAFEIFYGVFVFLLAAGALAFISFYRRVFSTNVVETNDKKNATLILPFHFLKKNRAFLGACFLTHIAASFPAVLFLFFVTDYLDAGDLAGLFLLLYFLSGAVFMPLWMKLVARYSHERAWFASMVLAISTFACALSLSQGDVVQFSAICVLSGAALGADLALPPLMLAQRLASQGGQIYAAQAYAILNLIPKTALALGTGCAFLLLDNYGFLPSGANTPEALMILAMLYAGAPCLLKAISAFIVFNLNDGATDDIQKRSSADGNTYGA